MQHFVGNKSQEKTNNECINTLLISVFITVYTLTVVHSIPHIPSCYSKCSVLKYPETNARCPV